LESARPRLYAVKSASVERALKALDPVGSVPKLDEPKKRLPRKLRLALKAVKCANRTVPASECTNHRVTDTERRRKRKAERLARRVNR